MLENLCFFSAIFTAIPKHHGTLSASQFDRDATVGHTQFLLCLHDDMDGSSEYTNEISDSAMEQDLAGIGEERYKISGKVYYCLKVTMLEATMHHDLVSGMREKTELFYYYGTEGFHTNYCITTNL